MKSHTMTMTAATPILAVAMLLFVSAASATIPTSISGLDVWLDGSDASTLFQDAAGTNPVTATGNPVALWKDKSGNSNNATAWVGGTPSVPTFTALALGGKSAVTFNGFQGLNNVTYAWPTAVDVFAVVSANSWSSANGYTTILTSKPATYEAGIALTGGAYDGWNTNEVLAFGNNWPSTPTPSTPRVNAPYGTLSNGQAAILDVSLSSSVAQIALNGTALTPTFQAANDTIQPKTGFNVATWSDGGSRWQGNIAELLIFNRTLSAGEANDVGFYLQEKYGIAGAYGPATYWAPSAGGGGTGTWSAANTNWASTAGTQGDRVQSSTGTLVFGNASGTVTVSGGVNVAAGMTFSTDGYIVTNSTIALIGANAASNTITTATSVGTTIASQLAGSNGMTKAGSGTLVLSGNNSYTGGTLISNGTLSISADTNLGAVPAWPSPGNVTFDLGKLLVTESFTLNSNRGLAMGAFGGTIEVAAGKSFAYDGVAAGAGGLTKSGNGTLTLSGANTYTGGTTVSSGTLNLNATGGGTLSGTSSVAVSTGATLLISQSEQVATSVVTLSGGTIQRASGVSETFGALNLTAASTLDYVGGVAGTLEFGDYEGDTAPDFKLTVNNFFAGNVLKFDSDLTSYIPVGTYNTNAFTSTYFDINSISGGFTASYSGSTFTITAIPEPSTVVVALGLTGLMLWPARRRLRTAGSRTITPS